MISCSLLVIVFIGSVLVRILLLFLDGEIYLTIHLNPFLTDPPFLDDKWDSDQGSEKYYAKAWHCGDFLSSHGWATTKRKSHHRRIMLKPVVQVLRKKARRGASTSHYIFL